MSKKIGLVVNVNLQTKGMLGIKNKTIGQAKGFSSNGVTVSLFCCDGPALVRVVYENGHVLDSFVLLPNIKSGTFFEALSTLLSSSEFRNDYWYFRYIPMIDNSMVRCAEKSAMTGKVFFEVPTYPYDRELAKEWADTDKQLQSELLPYVSGVFSPSFSEENNIFLGKKLIRMHNGIDLDLIPDSLEHSRKNVFNLIGIGWVSNWHGYDRVIKSIPAFISANPDTHFCFYIVGEGPNKNVLQELVDALGLNAYVSFTGALTGEALDNIYTKCVLGIASLGLHRLDPDGTFEVLKVREYLARGFPIVVSHKDSVDYTHLPGVFKADADDGDIELDFYYRKASSFWEAEESLQHQQYAKDNFSWQRITENMLLKMDDCTGNNS